MLGILGGTFDPIHYGHLRLALEFADGLGLDEVRLIPAGTPPHRDAPVAAAAERAAMVAAAVADEPRLRLDRRELERPGPSYAVDTLESLRQEVRDSDECDARITRSSCLGRCGEGPMVAVYPDGVWYGDLEPDDADSIVSSHLDRDRIVSDLVDQTL